MEDIKIDKNEVYEIKNTNDISPVLEGILLGVFALFTTFFTAYFIYTNSMEVLEQEMKEGLLRTVSGMAACIDGDKVSTFTEPKDADREDYQDMVKMLQKARLGTKHCSYVYINTIIDDKIYFIVDPISVDENGKPIFSDAASLEPSIPMTPYLDADEDLIKTAFYKGVPTITGQTYTDRWGTFHSAYAPIYNKERKIVGTLGADLRINDLIKRCKPMEDATKRAFIVSFSLAIILGISVWFSRRFTSKLNESRQSIYENFLIAKRFADQTSSSIKNHYQRTYSMLKYTSTKLDTLQQYEDYDVLKEKIKLEYNRIDKLADKFLKLSELKYSNNDKDLDSFSVLEENQKIAKQLIDYLSINDSNRVSYDIDRNIPETLYGPVIAYDELLGNLYYLCLSQFESNVYSKTILEEERENEVEIQQYFTISIKDYDNKRKRLAEAIRKNISSDNLEEQIKLFDSINIPIIQELLHILGTTINTELKDNIFKISFDFVLLKTQIKYEGKDK